MLNSVSESAAISAVPGPVTEICGVVTIKLPFRRSEILSGPVPESMLELIRRYWPWFEDAVVVAGLAVVGAGVAGVGVYAEVAGCELHVLRQLGDYAMKSIFVCDG